MRITQEAMAGLPNPATPDQVAERLGVTAQTVRNWAQRQRFPARKLGDRWMIAPEDLVGVRIPRTGRRPSRMPTGEIRRLVELRLDGATLQQAYSVFDKYAKNYIYPLWRRKRRIREQAAWERVIMDERKEQADDISE